MNDSIKRQLLESAELKTQLANRFCEVIADIARLCADSIKNGGKIMLCGNGGSAADSQHLAAELVVRLTAERDRKAFPAIALTTDTSILTAAANDYGFDHIFSRQIESLGKPGDVLIAISTSGNSSNVIDAVKCAGKMQIKTIAFTGQSGDKLAGLTDKVLMVPSASVQRIQEAHITVGHIIIDLIEKEIL